jgi:CcmD family protein
MIAFQPQTASGAPSGPGPSGTTPGDQPTEFAAVDPNAEQYSGSTLVVEAYAAIWIILMAWIFLLWRKQASLAERLDDLERTIDRAAAAAEKRSKTGVS